MKKHHFLLLILYASIIIISIVVVVLDSLELHLKSLITDFWMGNVCFFNYLPYLSCYYFVITTLGYFG